MQTQILHNVLLTFVLIMLSIMSYGRELRPAEHGLTTTLNSPLSSSTTTNDDVPKMISFFNGSGRRSSTHKPPVALPLADNITWINGGERGETTVHQHKRKDHVREVLLISSLVCGATGVVLLAVSVFVCVLLKFRKDKPVEDGKETTSLSNSVGKGTTSLSNSVDNVVLVQKGT